MITKFIHRDAHIFCCKRDRLLRVRLVFTILLIVSVITSVSSASSSSQPTAWQNSQYPSLTGMAVLDLFTAKGGFGVNESGGFFFPSDNVILYACVTYNDEGVADALVAFEVKNPLSISIIYATARTDANGIAQINFTISSQAPPNEILGTWLAIATSSVAQRFVSDELSFQVVEDPPLLGDINSDGRVDIRDAAIFSLAWNSVVGDANYDSRCDLNNDGEVNIVDATILALNWGKTL